MPPASSMLEGLEVAKHNSRESCWVIIKGKVYDVTDFLDEHPGGASIILRYGGKDATAEYDPIHPPGTIEESLPANKYLGPVDLATIPTAKNPQVVRDLAETRRSLCPCVCPSTTLKPARQRPSLVAPGPSTTPPPTPSPHWKGTAKTGTRSRSARASSATSPASTCRAQSWAKN